MEKRPSWHDYFMGIAQLVAQRSTCMRRQVGAIAVLDKQILATGYNGAPRGVLHCAEVGCLRQQMNVPSGERHEICRGVHAEQNVIVQAATHGVNMEGADLYCTHHPCSLCTRMLLNCGIKNIYYLDSYPDELSRTMLEEAGIAICQLKRREA